MYKSVIITFLIFVLYGTVYAGINITIDGNFDDWEYIPVLIKDEQDVQEPNGDLKSIKVVSIDETLYAMETVYGTAAPPPPDNQRYYYHLLIDADNKLKTGFNNSEYEGNQTGVENPIGADFYIQIGRRNGADDGIEVHFLTEANDASVAQDFEWMQNGDSLELAVPFEMFIAQENIGDIFKEGQTVKIAAFQEGSANNWEVDWTESAEYVLGDTFPVSTKNKLAVKWANLKQTMNW